MLLRACLFVLALMTPAAADQRPVLLGGTINDGTGDALRTAFGKLNANDAELYAALANKQPLDPTLSALAGVATSADRIIYATGVDAFATSALTAFGRGMVGSADATALKGQLAIGGADVAGIVRFDAAQALTAGQKAQARSNIGATGSTPAQTAFLGAGTFTTPSDVTTATVYKITVTGGGAGGSAGSANNVTGTGGGAGGTAVAYVTGFSATTGYAVTVGAGGGAGSNGASSSFTGPLLVYTGAAGQAAGAASGQGGSGGGATNGTVNIAGGVGGPVAVAGAWAVGGAGGSSFWGGGGGGAGSTPGGSGTNGTSGVAYGSGGGGGGSNASGAAGNGGAGAQGIVIVERLN